MLGLDRLLKEIPSFHQRAQCSLSSLVINVGDNVITNQGKDVWINLKTLCKQRSWEEALCLLDSKGQQNANFNYIEAYQILLQACVDMLELEGGRKIHAHLKTSKLGKVENLDTLLLLLYIKCHDFNAAIKVFDTMVHKDHYSWNLLIGGLVGSGQLENGFKQLCRIEYEGTAPSGITCVSILKACSTLAQLMIAHIYIVSLGVCMNSYLRHTFINTYLKCGSFEDAISMFFKMPNVSEISFNMLIGGYAQYGLLEKASELFELMKLRGFMPDEVTFVNIIKSCTCNYLLVKRTHLEIYHAGLASNRFVASALVDVYAGLEDMNNAYKAFGAAIFRDAPLWNSMLFCLAECGEATKALCLYAEMEKHKIVPDKVTFLSLLKACSSLKHFVKGKRVHSHILLCGFENEEFVGSSLVDMYVKCGNLSEAHHVFNKMVKRDLATWNAIIAGYCECDSPTEAFYLFHMMENCGVRPDEVTYLAVLKICANVGAFEQSKYIHTCICDGGLNTDVFIGSTLIDTFVKCGSLCHAREVFNKMINRDKISWSAMVAGYAQHGEADEAFRIFSRMLSNHIGMDDVTFVGVLTACSHAGLINEGFEYFDLMKNKFSIVPTSETCACMVDLLGKAGQIQAAVSFINRVDTELNSSVWMALLNASKLSCNVNTAEYASGEIHMLDPCCASAFVLLSNAYVSAGARD
ncbi:hypothetical protein KP509_07G067800 [Ceratopteris richardii]|uniref:Pentatricopeptide repeat-containing protein n=1 Tax=Ceratopteris richardii TaxID=49495 RepID=A0A8T2UFH8_CERRI|nr:hypothetical protein KP509_07G067800 [Ceratopteris richardii]